LNTSDNTVSSLLLLKTAIQLSFGGLMIIFFSISRKVMTQAVFNEHDQPIFLIHRETLLFGEEIVSIR